MRHVLAVALATACLAGCQTAPDTVAVPVPVTQTAVAHVDTGGSADDNLNAVLWMQSTLGNRSWARSKS